MAQASFKIVTLGCKVNQYEGQALRRALLDAHLSEVGRGARPSLCVINTCCVTAEAARQSRQAIRKAVADSPAGRVYVTGCYAHQAACDDVLSAIPGVTAIDDDKTALLKSIIGVGTPARLPPVAEFAGHTRAFVKVQDGCNASCSYCIVRRVRPHPRSRPVAEVVEEVRRLSHEHREIVLCGIHLGKYGVDLNERVSLAGLVGRLLDIAELGRLRLSSIDPLEVTEGLVNLISENSDRLCPHLHLPLQSGDDSVLERMRLPYRAADYLRVVGGARSRIDRLSITTDVMVGFPGETDAAFDNTARVCRAAGFSRIHVFPFSARRGTDAAEMGPRVRPEVVKSRCRHLSGVADTIARRYRAALIGTEARVVVESLCDGRAGGLSERYVRVSAPVPLRGSRPASPRSSSRGLVRGRGKTSFGVEGGADVRRGRFLTVHLTGVTATGMKGECVDVAYSV